LRVLTAPTMPHMVLVPEVQTGAHRSQGFAKEACEMHGFMKRFIQSGCCCNFIATIA
jgi:NaMN:DMB phosphoribosyltransferase